MTTKTTTIALAGGDYDSDNGNDPQQPLVLALSEHLGPPGSDSDIHLILASQSPRRTEILDMMGLQGRFSQIPSPMNEEAFQIELSRDNPVEYTRKSAEEKAKALAQDIVKTTTRPTLVLGSDTIVDLNGNILEKPADEADAKRMLTSMAGRMHCVHTGVALYLVVPKASGDDSSSSSATQATLVTSFTDTAEVCFAELEEKDINAYIATKEPMDKAGAYGIQGIGGQLVQKVDGDYFCVMGLPMHRTSVALAEAISKIMKNV